ncbi:MAG: hypothetical protein AAGJ54_00865 [Planctomycetota bacterium]
MKSVTFAALAASASLAAPASADVLFSNFGPGDSVAFPLSYAVGGEDPGGFYGGRFNNGFAFSVFGPDDYVVDSIEVAGRLFGGDNAFRFSIFTAVPATIGVEPGDLVASTVASGFNSGLNGGQPSISEGLLAPGTVLENGRVYFLVGEATDPLGEFAWAQSPLTGNDGRTTWATRVGDPATTPWTISNSQSTAFRINGSFIPAPGTAATLGLIGLAATRRRR